MSPFQRLLSYAFRYRRAFVAGLVCVMITQGVTLAAPIVLRHAIDDLTGGVTRAKLLEYGSLLFAIGIVGGFFRFLMRRILIGASRDIEYDMRNDFFAHLEKLPLAYFQSHRTGDLMSRATNDLNAVRMMIGPSVMYSANTVLTFVAALAMMLSIDARLTLFALIPLPFVSISVKYFGSAIHTRFEAIQAQLSDVSAVTQEALSGVRVVRAYRQEAAELERFRQSNDEYLRRNRRLITLQGFFFPSMSFFLGLGAIVVLWLGSRDVIRGRITVGEFVAFNSYLTMLAWPMIAFGWVTNMLQRGMASWKRMLEVLDTQPAISDVRLKPDTTTTAGPPSPAPVVPRDRQIIASSRVVPGDRETVASSRVMSGDRESVASRVVSGAGETIPSSRVVPGAGETIPSSRVVPGDRETVASSRVVSGDRETVASSRVVSGDRETVASSRVVSGAGETIASSHVVPGAGETIPPSRVVPGDRETVASSHVVSGFSRTVRGEIESGFSRTVRGEIEFRDLLFGFNGTPVLDHVSAKIHAGQTVALVGPTGSGKSTLISLLARLHDPPPGTVLVDGVDVRDWPLSVLREAIGFVPQEPFLFSDSLADNVAFGLDAIAEASRGSGGHGASGESRRAEASAERQTKIERAAAIARLDKDVADFPKGYETMVGERGITLSGGQKQRTALARAIVIDPRILILDDALSAVDTYTEEEILSRLRGVMRERTAIIVSHRISTVRDADQILVLDRGRIAERGTHAELIRQDGLYAELHKKQLLEEELAAS